jgi:hypothetical protein
MLAASDRRARPTAAPKAGAMSAGSSVQTMGVSMNAWRELAAMPDHRGWPETWVEGSPSTLRAVGLARETLRQFTVGLAAVRMRCLLFGHDDRIAREPNRLLLRCDECGRRTPGWAIATSAPRRDARLLDRSVRSGKGDWWRRAPPPLRILR